MDIGHHNGTPVYRGPVSFVPGGTERRLNVGTTPRALYQHWTDVKIKRDARGPASNVSEWDWTIFIPFAIGWVGTRSFTGVTLRAGYALFVHLSVVDLAAVSPALVAGAQFIAVFDVTIGFS